ncbi:hypothetical protein BDM02DRAFT_2034051 [Thelephora ganbajun]|uniref:Uncharacterized protein n=1 Tax=Thelephora ganbajun TaxID=370292 RepID=A0ACB6ZHD7_THEGA|nr:hypothetical protein BDM02DRAFT_2034051 [Thelephora ganbajun]
MFSRRQPGPKDATTSAGTGRNASPPIIIAPVPRRATSGSILASDSSSDGERYYSRQPLPNTPLQSSTPSVLNQQLPLNGIPDTQNSLFAGRNVYIPHYSHTRTNSGSSARSNFSASPRKSAHFSPNLTATPPEQMHNPPPPGATPIRSAMRQTPSPARTSPQYQLPTHSPSTDSAPDIYIVHPTPPSPTSPAFATHRSHREPSNWRTNAGESSSDDSEGDATPGQRASRPPPPVNQGNGSPIQRRSPSERGLDDSGYFSPQSSVLPKSHSNISATQS